MRNRFLVIVWVALLIPVGCVQEDQAAGSAGADAPLRIVATTSMLADLARAIGGERVVVEGLMGPGVDPHLYKASEGDVTRMARAAIIFYNGLHLEGKMTEVFEQMQRRGKPTVALAEEAIPDSLLLESPNFAGNFDPHVWFSVPLWVRVAHEAAAALAELDPDHAGDYHARAVAYEQSLVEVDEYAKERSSELPPERRILITSHDAFGYFGQTYGFEVRGLQGISTAAEAGTADVQELADFVASRRVPAIFVESSVPQRGIEAVREAVRARGFDVRIGGTLYGDALGGPDSGADDYEGMVRANIDTIVDGLKGDPPS